MIEVFALRGAEIGTTPRFGICWHGLAEPDLMFDVGGKAETHLPG
jgi:hypothetical protein